MVFLILILKLKNNIKYTCLKSVLWKTLLLFVFVLFVLLVCKERCYLTEGDYDAAMTALLVTK
jgi:hypothetical protein